jgi:hypothetical protein
MIASRKSLGYLEAGCVSWNKFKPELEKCKKKFQVLMGKTRRSFKPARDFVK